MAKSSLTNQDAQRLNPLIQEGKDDSLYSALCAVKAIARVMSDRADMGQSDALLDDEVRGLGFLCECIGAALQYEIDGRVAA